MADRPLRAELTWDSTREEVLAAVEEQERRLAAADKAFAAADFSHVPENPVGCYWSKCGRFKVHYGHPREIPEVIRRQNPAGEEDQSVPGWDDCP